MRNLKPCPFCGKKPIEDSNGPEAFVSCVGCMGNGPSFNFADWGDEAKDKAAKAWNERWVKSFYVKELKRI